MIEPVLRFIKSLVPARMFAVLQPAYHFALATVGVLLYRFPGKRITVVGVTGTKGKSSVIEFANAVFETAGWNTALAGTIRHKIGDHSEANTRRMTMAGRFATQRFLRRAVNDGCDVVFLEVTSEGARQHRHRFLYLDALVFTNLTPEHIESHGSFEDYAAAKLSIARALERSPKRPRAIIANADDAYGSRFLAHDVEASAPFSIADAGDYTTDETGGAFTFKDTAMHTHLPGEFSIMNALAAAVLAHTFGIKIPQIARGIESLKITPGRAERIDAGQTYPVVVDYAHTPDSLEALYKAYGGRRKICVLGATGGGRDTWKRPEMGRIADAYCTRVILTNEDPYDEDPRSIIEAIAAGCTKTPEVIIDRRAATRRAIEYAEGGAGDAVLITGKGTDPTISTARGTSIPWSDAVVAREELENRHDAQQAQQ